MLFTASCDQRNIQVELPFVVVGSADHDFGFCHQGDHLHHTFALKNQSSKEVTISKVLSSCGCLVATPTTTTVAAGGTVNIPVVLEVGGRQEVANGKILVFCGATEHEAETAPFVTLTVVSRIKPDYRITPRRIDFGRVDGLVSKTAAASFVVAAQELDNLVISEITPSTDLLTATVNANLSTQGSLYHIEVALDVSSFTRTRSYDATLLLATNSERAAKSLVPVHVEYVSPVTMKPDVLLITSDEVGEVEKQLVASTSNPSKILGVSCNHPGIRLQFEGSKVDCEHSVRIVATQKTDAALESVVECNFEMYAPGRAPAHLSSRTPIFRFTRGRMTDEKQ